MKQSQTRFFTLNRIVLIICVVLGLIHVILLGWAYQRRTATEQLTEDRIALEENLSQLQEINQGQLDALQDELAGVQAEITALEVSFPELGTPFPIYRRGLTLATESRVDLLEISLLSTNIVDTVSGEIVKKQYAIETLGTLENCLAFMAALEDAGQDTILWQFASILPGEKRCSLEISTLGHPQ